MNIIARIAVMTLKSWFAFLIPMQIHRNARVVDQTIPANACLSSPFSAAVKHNPRLQPAAAAQALSVEQVSPHQAGCLEQG
jgi:hypothetical protein